MHLIVAIIKLYEWIEEYNINYININSLLVCVYVIVFMISNIFIDIYTSDK